MNLRERTEKQLALIEERGQRRELKPPLANSIDLSSNDYLGLANDARLKNAMIAEIGQNGCGSTGSRLLRGDRQIFALAENRFAEFKQMKRAVFFGSGYAANIGVLTVFAEAGDVVFSDALNHASIIDGLRLSKAERIIFPHNDACALENLIEETLCKGQKYLIVESLFSMDGDFAPLKEYAGICRKHDVALIIDEAHAVGVFGKRGSGLIEDCEIEQNTFLSINTAGKALGAAGAFVAGESWAIEYLIQRARSFIFSTAPPPAVAAALVAAIDVIEREPGRRQKLLQLSQTLRELLIANRITVSPGNSHIISIIIGDSLKTVLSAAQLQSKGFDVRAIRPPTVAENTARLRISLNSNLEETVLHQFVAALKIVLGTLAQ